LGDGVGYVLIAGRLQELQPDIIQMALRTDFLFPEIAFAHSSTLFFRTTPIDALFIGLCVSVPCPICGDEPSALDADTPRVSDSLSLGGCCPSYPVASERVTTTVDYFAFCEPILTVTPSMVGSCASKIGDE
jgi:hypothetical protein